MVYATLLTAPSPDSLFVTAQDDSGRAPHLPRSTSWNVTMMETTVCTLSVLGGPQEDTLIT